MIRHGFYQSCGLAYPHLITSYWREQYARGMRTAAVNGWAALCPAEPQVGLVAAVEALMDAGLAPAGEPLLLFADPNDVYAAKQMSLRPWPEIVMPNMDDPSPEQFDDVVNSAREAHRLYFRSSLFVSGNYVKEGKRRDGGPGGILGEPVDIWVVQAHTWQQDTVKNAKALGKELWAAYTVAATGYYDHMRYYAGLWCWAHGPKQALVWAYTHTAQTMIRPDGSISYPENDHWSFAIPKCDGTVQATPGYEGYEQGIKDCRELERMEALNDPGINEYLRNLRNSAPFQMARPGKMLPELQGPEALEQLRQLEGRYRSMGEACLGEQCRVSHEKARSGSFTM